MRNAWGMALFFVGAGLMGCETEVDVNAPFEDVAVVYALFDPGDSTHNVKVTRLFQGGADANDLAANRSLQEYDGLTGVLEEVSLQNGDTVVLQSYDLTEREVNQKDSGLFYYPQQTIYTVENTVLNDGSLYRLNLTKPNGEQVSGITPLVRFPSFESAFDQSRVNIWRVRGMAMIGNNNEVVQNIEVDVNAPIYGKAVDFVLKFYYYEEYTDGSRSELKSEQLNIGSFVFDVTREREEDLVQNLTVDLNPVQFFEFINRTIPDLGPNTNIVRRIPDSTSIGLELYYAGEELHTYMEVSEPSTSLLEDKPAYTNVSNGIGIISARTFESEKVRLTSATYDELADGVILGLTGAKGFCNPAVPNGSPNACGP